MLQAGRSRIRFSMRSLDFSIDLILPAALWGFFLLHNVQTGCGAHPVSYPGGSGALSRGVKRPRREVEHSPTSTTEVKNGGAITSLPYTSS
jgi:hypothetical protein